MKRLSQQALKEFLDEKSDQFNQPGFIENDPISIPHLFKKQQDIEIAGLLAAVLAWGKRSVIIRKCKELIQLMDGDPHNFIVQHTKKDLRRFTEFKHRTFNTVDTLYFIEFLKSFYQQHDSLEHAFHMSHGEPTTQEGLANFHTLFFSLANAPHRTKKHIPTPDRQSACKRLNMYLRWMVRNDNRGVDFGLWKNISTAQLVCPCDLHVERVARKLKLITRKQTDWAMALELTSNLKQFDANDPVKYDFALFGLGIEEHW